MKCLAGEEVMSVQAKKDFIWDRVRAERCPFNALTVLDEKAYHCDLCGGNPQCIEVCTTEAISIAK
jgi:MinD superfamily P-loop ATPase